MARTARAAPPSFSGDDFRAALGVADGVLSRRLAAMVDDGLMTRAPYRSGNRTREEYLLTDAGRDLLPVLHALVRWGETHRPRPTGRRSWRLPGSGPRRSLRQAICRVRL